MSKDFSVYLLRCEDNRRYSGSTLTHMIQERYKQHLAGRGSKWTHRFPPLGIIQVWHEMTSAEAFVFEHELCEQQMLLHKDLDACRGGRHNFPNMGPETHWWCPRHLLHLTTRGRLVSSSEAAVTGS